MDQETVGLKKDAPAGKVRFRIVAAGKGKFDLANQADLAAAANVETIGNHFLETMEKIREKNKEVAAARAGNVLSRTVAIKTL